MKKTILMLSVLFSVQVSASVAGLPKYLSDLVKLVAINVDSTANTLSRRVRDANYNVAEVAQFQKQFKVFTSKNAWKPETVIGHDFIPVGQVLANGQPKVFSAVNFYVVQQSGPFQIALGAVKMEQVETMLKVLDDSGIQAFRSAGRSLSFNTVHMADDSTMQMATFVINRRQLDESDLQQIVRALRDVVDQAI